MTVRVCLVSSRRVRIAARRTLHLTLALALLASLLLLLALAAGPAAGSAEPAAAQPGAGTAAAPGPAPGSPENPDDPDRKRYGTAPWLLLRPGRSCGPRSSPPRSGIASPTR